MYATQSGMDVNWWSCLVTFDDMLMSASPVALFPRQVIGRDCSILF